MRHSLVFLMLGVSLTACQPEPSTTDIHVKLRSPDGRLTAIYSEDLSGGPATGVSEDVYIVDGERFPRVADRVFSNECVHKLRIAWEGPSTIRIEYEVGRDIHEDISRDGPQRTLPWLWEDSPAKGVRVRLVRHLMPAGNGC